MTYFIVWNSGTFSIDIDNYATPMRHNVIGTSLTYKYKRYYVTSANKTSLGRKTRELEDYRNLREPTRGYVSSRQACERYWLVWCFIMKNEIQISGLTMINAKLSIVRVWRSRRLHEAWGLQIRYLSHDKLLERLCTSIFGAEMCLDILISAKSNTGDW